MTEPLIVTIDHFRLDCCPFPVGSGTGLKSETAQRLLDAYEMTGIDKAALTTRLDELTTEDDALHVRKAELPYDLDEDGCGEVPLEALHMALSDVNQLLEMAPPEQKSPFCGY